MSFQTFSSINYDFTSNPMNFSTKIRDISPRKQTMKNMILKKRGGGGERPPQRGTDLFLAPKRCLNLSLYYFRVFKRHFILQ